MTTLVDTLARAATSKRGVRFVQADESASFYPYSVLYARARATAGALYHVGLRRGDTVALVLPTGPFFYDAFFGALLAGAIPVPLYPPLRLGKMAEYHRRTAAQLTACRASVVLTDGRIRRLLGQATEQSRPKFGCIDMACLQPAEMQQVQLAQAAIALIQFSSGTTVQPKAVALTHGQIMANIAAIAHRLSRDAPPPAGMAQHTAVSWLPLYHDMGLIGCVLTALFEQTDLTLIRPEAFIARPSLWLRTIARYRATVSAAPNFAYSLCAERITSEQMQGVDLSCWQVALNGAEAISATTLARFAQRFAAHGLRPQALTPVYGLAEAALAVTFASPGQQARVLNFDTVALERDGQAIPTPSGRPLVSLGTPLNGYAVRITDTTGAAVTAGRTGRVFVRGPSVMQGYYEQPEATTAVMHAGWLDTGDVGFVFEHELFLVGRAKDLIIVRGRNYAPHDIEQSLDGLPGVRPGCVVAVAYTPARHDGEALLLLAERRPAADGRDDATVEKSIRTAIALACNLTPHAVVLCASGCLPRTSSGKLRRQAALAQYLEGKLVAPASVSWLRMAKEMLRSRGAMRRAQDACRSP